MNHARTGWGLALGLAVGLVGIHALLVLVTLGELLFWVPAFEAMLAEFGMALPIPTQMTITASRSLRGLWFLWFPVLALCGALDLAHLALLARARRWFWALVLGLFEVVPLLLVPALVALSLYLPIFTMAGAIE